MRRRSAQRRTLRNLRMAVGPVAIVAVCGIAAPVAAAPASITVTADQELRFGSFVAGWNGWRQVSSSGAVTSSGIYPAGSDPVGPAQFTITYDRGNQSRRTISITVQVMIAGEQTVSSNGVTGVLSGLESDLPGAGTGAVQTFTIADCRERLCTQTFRVGGRLELTSVASGATLSFPLPVTATVLDVF